MHLVKEALKETASLCQKQTCKVLKHMLWVTKDLLLVLTTKMKVMVGEIFGPKNTMQMESIKHTEKDSKKKTSLRPCLKVLPWVKEKFALKLIMSMEWFSPKEIKVLKEKLVIKDKAILFPMNMPMGFKVEKNIANEA